MTLATWMPLERVEPLWPFPVLRIAQWAAVGRAPSTRRNSKEERDQHVDRNALMRATITKTFSFPDFLPFFALLRPASILLEIISHPDPLDEALRFEIPSGLSSRFVVLLSLCQWTSSSTRYSDHSISTLTLSKSLSKISCFFSKRLSTSQVALAKRPFMKSASGVRSQAVKPPLNSGES